MTDLDTAAGNREITIVSLYPRDMNIYGDRGNVLALTRRAEAHGFSVNIIEVNPGDELPEGVDIILGGGGQDSGQGRVVADLAQKGAEIQKLASDGVPMLMVCGLFQLFGHRFVTQNGEELTGIGVLDVETRAGGDRIIGNIVLDSDDFGEIIGYENHSGVTVLGGGSQPFGKVTLGVGNSADGGVEGARTHNVIGTYLHGALLPKNPAVSDFLIEQAARRRFGGFENTAVISSTVERARDSAKRRPR